MRAVRARNCPTAHAATSMARAGTESTSSKRSLASTPARYIAAVPPPQRRRQEDRRDAPAKREAGPDEERGEPVDHRHPADGADLAPAELTEVPRREQHGRDADTPEHRDADEALVVDRRLGDGLGRSGRRLPARARRGRRRGRDRRRGRRPSRGVDAAGSIAAMASIGVGPAGGASGDGGATTGERAGATAPVPNRFQSRPRRASTRRSRSSICSIRAVSSIVASESCPKLSVC